MATTLKINEIIKRSGNRKNLNLAIVDSIKPTAKQKAKIIIGIKAKPKLKNKFAPKKQKIKNLLKDAHSIKANLFPEYSRIIDSWIIVNSKWVAGLSKGNRAVSASKTIKNPAKAKIPGKKD